MKQFGKVDYEKQQIEKLQKSRRSEQDYPMPMHLNSIALDRFSYAKNCPTGYDDPTGHKECNIAEAITGALLVVGTEALAIVVAGITLYATKSEPIAFEAFEAVNIRTYPAFLTGFGLMIDSGCVKLAT